MALGSKFDAHLQKQIFKEASREFKGPHTATSRPEEQIPQLSHEGDQVKQFFQCCLKLMEDPSTTQKLMTVLKIRDELPEEPISAPLPERGVR